MKNVTHNITARNKDNQWNWNGFDFVQSGRGDSTTLECDPSEWEAAKAAFAYQFADTAAAVLTLEKVTFDEDTEEFEEESIETVTA